MVAVCDASSAASVKRGAATGKTSAKSRNTWRGSFSIYGASEQGESFITQGGGACGIPVCYTFAVPSLENLFRKFISDQASHLYRAVLEHGAAGVGIHARSAGRQIRAVVHGALAARRSLAR